MSFFLGIDVGSSKTHALIVDETGQCVGFGRSSGGNHQGFGSYVVRDNMVRTAKELVK